MVGFWKSLVVVAVFVCRFGQAKLCTRLIYEFPNTSWIENAAIRSDGSILFTSVFNPGGLHTINPLDGSEPKAVTNAFEQFNVTVGIVETIPDTFYVIASNFSFPAGVHKGTNTLFKVLFRPNGSTETTRFLTVPQAGFLNGLTKFNDTLLLAADSQLGVVWSIDTMSQKVDVAANDTLMTPLQTAGQLQEGINGLQYRNGTLYFTNSQRMTFCKVELDNNGRQNGPSVMIATPIIEKGVDPNWDDFAIDKAIRYAYVATEKGNSIQRVDLHNGNVEILAGSVNSTLIAEPTSARFGRMPQDEDTIYVFTAGGLADPVYTNHTDKRIGAQILAVEL